MFLYTSSSSSTTTTTYYYVSRLASCTAGILTSLCGFRLTQREPYTTTTIHYNSYSLSTTHPAFLLLTFSIFLLWTGSFLSFLYNISLCLPACLTTGCNKSISYSIVLFFFFSFYISSTQQKRRHNVPFHYYYLHHHDHLHLHRQILSTTRNTIINTFDYVSVLCHLYRSNTPTTAY